MLKINIAKFSSFLFASIYGKIIISSLLLFLFFPSVPQVEILTFSPIEQKPTTDLELNLLTKWELLVKITNKNFFPIKFDNLTISASAKKVKIAYGSIEKFHLKLCDSQIYSVIIIVPIYHNRNHTNIYNECLNSSLLKLDVNLLGEMVLSGTASIFLGTSFIREIDCFNKIKSVT